MIQVNRYKFSSNFLILLLVAVFTLSFVLILNRRVLVFNTPKTQTTERYQAYQYQGKNGKSHVVVSNFDYFKDIEAQYELTTMGELPERYLYSVETYMDDNTGSMYIGFLNPHELGIETPCNYTTDTYKYNEDSGFQKIFSYSDCADIFPHRAPTIVRNVINDRYLVMTASLCSECSVENKPLDKVILYDTVTNTKVIMENTPWENITDDQVVKQFQEN